MSITTTSGFTRASAGPSLGERARRSRTALLFILLFAAVLTVIALTRNETNTTPLSVFNSQPSGARALSQVLQSQGVEVREIEQLNAARITSPAETTLVIVEGFYLQPFQASSILGYPGDIVVVGSADPLFEHLDTDLRETARFGGPPLPAQCDHPDALAAGTITAGEWAITGDLPSGFTGCFPDDDDAFHMVTSSHEGRTITVLANTSLVTNGAIADAGNAALALRTLGKHENLVWYLGSELDSSPLTWLIPDGGGQGGGDIGSIEATPDFLPPGTGTVLYALGATLIVIAVWRARRFGPLVRESLPVVIRASESTRGRARLYRAAAAYGRAGSSLRAATATRMGRRLGVPRHDDGVGLTTAIARATGRSAQEVGALIYGPPPTSEQDMMDLATALDQLEGEVHRS